MASSSLFHAPLSLSHSRPSFSSPYSNLSPLPLRLAPLSAMKNPKPKSKKKRMKQYQQELKLQRESEQSYQQDDSDSDIAIPQVVTDRMMRRVGFSVGIPLSLGLSFFPFFYYLKKVVKIDVPTWIPFGVSFVFFGSALIGVSYGIVSASWDPVREGSLIGWNEARKNWPVFWESLRGKKD